MFGLNRSLVITRLVDSVGGDFIASTLKILHFFHSFSYSFYFIVATQKNIATRWPQSAQWHRRIIIMRWMTLMKTECVKCTQINPFSSPEALASLAKCSSRNICGKIRVQLHTCHKPHLNSECFHFSFAERVPKSRNCICWCVRRKGGNQTNVYTTSSRIRWVQWNQLEFCYESLLFCRWYLSASVRR